MGWRRRAVAIGVAWIVVPWSWAIGLELRRRGRSADDDEGASAA